MKWPVNTRATQNYMYMPDINYFITYSKNIMLRQNIARMVASYACISICDSVNFGDTGLSSNRENSGKDDARAACSNPTRRRSNHY